LNESGIIQRKHGYYKMDKLKCLTVYYNRCSRWAFRSWFLMGDDVMVGLFKTKQANDITKRASDIAKQVDDTLTTTKENSTKEKLLRNRTSF